MELTREELLKIFQKAGVEYLVMNQDGPLLQVNFIVEIKEDA